MPAVLTQSGEDVLVAVRAVPRAKRDELAGRRGDAVLVRVAAPPVDGKANVAVARVLAKALGVPPTSVTVERGLTARDKVVRVARTTVAEVQVRIERW